MMPMLLAVALSFCTPQSNLAGTYFVAFSDDTPGLPFVITFCEDGRNHHLSGDWYGTPEIEYYGHLKGHVTYTANHASFAVALKLVKSKCRLLLHGAWSINSQGVPVIGGSYSWSGCHPGDTGSFVSQ